MSVTQVKPRAADILAQMPGGKLYRQAYAEGKSLTAFLNDALAPEDGLDGYEQVCRAAGVKLNSDPEAGYYADNWGDGFDKRDETRALIPEFVARQVRKVKFGGAAHGKRLITTSDLEALGGVSRPYEDAMDIRRQQIAPAIPLSALVALTTPISGDAYRAAYLTQPTAAELRMVRIGQAAEIPRVKMLAGDHTVRLHKYGRAIEVSYEVLRRTSIDKVALWIQLAAIQSETDKVATVLDIAVSGDGNGSTAATEYNLLTLDSGTTANVLSLKGWLSFKMKFANPYRLDVVLMREATGLQLLMLNVGSANFPLFMVSGQAGFGGLTPINSNLADGVRYGITTEAPSAKIVGLDSRFAIERVTEVGSDISEVERFALRQTQAITFTETEGYMVIDQAATKVLDLAE